jgi:hypothetical protein
MSRLFSVKLLALILQGTIDQKHSLSRVLMPIQINLLSGIADILRGDGNIFSGIFLDKSWWLSIPLLLNSMILFPLLPRRMFRIK